MDTKYNTIHKWKIRQYGKAIFCVNKKCERKSTRYEWALIRGRKHSRNPYDYLWLCKKCHANYDWNNIDIDEVIPVKFKKKIYGKNEMAISEHYRILGRKSAKARQKKILEEAKRKLVPLN